MLGTMSVAWVNGYGLPPGSTPVDEPSQGVGRVWHSTPNTLSKLWFSWKITTTCWIGVGVEPKAGLAGALPTAVRLTAATSTGAAAATAIRLIITTDPSPFARATPPWALPHIPLPSRAVNDASRAPPAVLAERVLTLS